MHTKARLPTILSLGSLLLIITLLFLTNPLKNLGFVIIFFILLYVLLLSSGRLIAGLQGKSISPITGRRIMLVSTFIVILLMFRSAGSLNLLDVFILLMIGAGLFFYFGRR